MDILWITYDWSTDLGGKGRVATAWTRALAENGYDVTLLDLEIGRRERADVERRGLHPAVRLEARGVKSLFVIAPPLISFFRRRQFDVVILSAAPNIDLIAFALMKMFRLSSGAKMIRIEHTNPFQYFRRSRYRIFYELLARVLWRRLDATIVPTGGVKELFGRHYGIPAAKLQKMHWPAIGDQIEILARESVPEEIFAPGRKYSILTSAMRFSPQDKDFDTILRAFRIVAGKMDAVLVLLGQGDATALQRKIHELGLSGRVFILGFRENPFAYFAKSDVFLFASHYEGCPLVLLEVMASGCGCPVVSTDTDFGPGEIIVDGENGFLVPLGDHEAMAERALRILHDEGLREKFVKNGKERAQNWRQDASSREFAEYVASIL